VVKPRSAEEVRQVVALARDEGIAVTVRGGGTGLWGGAVPVRGGVAVSTENLAGAPEIHRDDLYVVVGAGTITGELRDTVEMAGLFYPVDPASEASSTVGGNVGEGARGLRSLKYGTTRNYVLGLELVTGEGKLVSVGAKTVKNVAGYDLTRLMVGSEGTLAIATSVTLRVLPLPPDEVVLAFALPDAATAARAAAEIMAQGLNPSLVEFADRESLRTVARNPWSDAGALLMVGFDGTKSRCEEQASKVQGILRSECAAAPAAEVRRPDCERVLKVRRSVLTGLLESSRVVRLESLSVPPARLDRLVERISELSRSSGLGMAVWGHAGDGAIHVAVLGDPAERDTDRNVTAAIEVLSDVAGVCEDLGGAACGGAGLRHGMPAARLAVTGVGLDVLKELKRAMDPKGIMNPGKMNYDA
jgi:glycolate oxidase